MNGWRNIAVLAGMGYIKGRSVDEYVDICPMEIYAWRQCTALAAWLSALSKYKARIQNKSAELPTKGIFVSYRRKDRPYATSLLVNRLGERYGDDRIFHDLQDIDIGDNFLDRINLALESCSALIAIVGPDWLKHSKKNCIVTMTRFDWRSEQRRPETSWSFLFYVMQKCRIPMTCPAT